MIGTRLVLVLIVLNALCSCGGGSDAALEVSGPASQPGSVIVALATAVTGTLPPSTTINSYVAMIVLPEGVTVRTDPTSSATAAGVVVAAGKALGALVNGVYTPPSGSEPGMVKIYVVSATGFEAGEFCTVYADISPGYHPSAADIGPPILEESTGFDDDTNSTVTGLEKELSIAASIVIR